MAQRSSLGLMDTMEREKKEQEKSEDVPGLEAKSVVKQYRSASEPALKDFSLHIDQGEFFGLLGINGAGKTTAVSIFSGLALPDRGHASVLGFDVVRQAAMVKRCIGLVPQDIALYEDLSASENLRFFGKIYGLRGEKLRDRVEQCLCLADLSQRAHERVRSFSGGMKRRLNLAVGLVHEPRVLILDEPTVGVDIQSRQMIHESLLALNRSGTTIVYTSHYLEEVEKLCSHIGILDNGSILVAGPPKELLDNAGQATLESLFLQLTGKHLRNT